MTTKDIQLRILILWALTWFCALASLKVVAAEINPAVTAYFVIVMCAGNGIAVSITLDKVKAVMEANNLDE